MKEMEGKQNAIQRGHQKDSKGVETDSNGQGKGNRNAWRLMDITGIGPQQLLTYSQIQIQHCIEGQIACVRNLLHGKLRSDRRQKSTKLLQKGRKRPKKGN